MPEIIQFFRDRLGPEPPFERVPAFFLPRPEVEGTLAGPALLRFAPRVPRFGADEALESSEVFELRGLDFLVQEPSVDDESVQAHLPTVRPSPSS